MKGGCLNCGEDCERIGEHTPHGYKAYCCWCVPSAYITKPVKDWMCDYCKNKP